MKYQAESRISQVPRQVSWEFYAYSEDRSLYPKLQIFS